MASTTFEDFNPNIPIVAAWLNDVNNQVYNGTPPAGPAVNQTVSGNLAVVGTTSLTGPLTPTGGIVGVTNGGNAAAGQIGEFVTATGAATPLTTNTPANAVSLNLTAGDWEVSGVCVFSPAAATVVTSLIVGVSTVSATIGAFGTFDRSEVQFQPGVTANTLHTPTSRISTAVPVTVFLVVQAGFTGGTESAIGLLRARRVR